MGFIVDVIPTTAELRAISQIVEQVRSGQRGGDAQVSFAERLGYEARSSLDRISSTIENLLEHRGSNGVLVLDLGGLCNDELHSLPPTPTSFVPRDHHVLTSLDIARCALLGAAGGFTYTYSSQANGTLCDDVFPLKEYANVRGFSAGADLGWHTEDAPFNRSDDDLEHPAFDVFSFAYLRNPHEDPTAVAMPDFSKMDGALLRELRKAQFTTRTSISHGGDKYTQDQSTSFVYGEEKMRFSFARLDEQRDDYARNGVMEIIDDFIEFLNRSRSEIPGRPGTVAFIDNMRVAHARGTWKVPPLFDGSDRWQRRAGCARNLRRPFLESLMPNPENRTIEADRLKSYLSQLRSAA